MQFKDINLQKKYDKHGYVVLHLLEKEDILHLRELYNKININQVANFQVSNYEKDPIKNKYIDSEIKKILLPQIAEYFQDYKTLNGFFYIKFTSENSSFYIHKDWNIVDENKNQSMHIWIPLTDTDASNGNLFFCPLEYKLDRKTLRGSPGFEYPTPHTFIKWINKIYQKDIYTKVGQAICFKHSIPHGSRNNQSGEVRVAAGISITDKEATLVHYHKNKEGVIEKHEVKDDFYLNFDLVNPL